jgi:hypothetical protein
VLLMAISEAQLIGRLRRAQAKDLLRRGFKVQARARTFVSGGGGHVKRVDTGQLRSSLQVQLRSGISGSPFVRVGTGVKHARWVHEGTGLYGPKRQRIYPKSAQVLVFRSVKYGAKKGKFRGKVAVRSVKGMRRNQYLKDALPAAKG